MSWVSQSEMGAAHSWLYTMPERGEVLWHSAVKKHGFVVIDEANNGLFFHVHRCMEKFPVSWKRPRVVLHLCWDCSRAGEHEGEYSLWKMPDLNPGFGGLNFREYKCEMVTFPLLSCVPKNVISGERDSTMRLFLMQPTPGVMGCLTFTLHTLTCGRCTKLLGQCLRHQNPSSPTRADVSAIEKRGLAAWEVDGELKSPWGAQWSTFCLPIAWPASSWYCLCLGSCTVLAVPALPSGGIAATF